MSQYEYSKTPTSELVDLRSYIDDTDFEDWVAALLLNGFAIIREGVFGKEILLTFKRDLDAPE